MIYFIEIVKELMDNPGNVLQFLKIMPKLLNLMVSSNERAFSTPEFQELLKDEQFDVVIFEELVGDGMFGLGAHFNCSIVLFSTVEGTNSINKLLGNSNSVSFVSNPVMGHHGPMNFMERVQNFIINFIFECLTTYLREYKMRTFYQLSFYFSNNFLILI